MPTVEQSVRENALEVQDIRELGLGWAWFVNDLRAFLPAWQDMEVASPSPDVGDFVNGVSATLKTVS